VFSTPLSHGCSLLGPTASSTCSRTFPKAPIPCSRTLPKAPIPLLGCACVPAPLLGSGRVEHRGAVVHPVDTRCNGIACASLLLSAHAACSSGPGQSIFGVHEGARISRARGAPTTQLTTGTLRRRGRPHNGGVPPLSTPRRTPPRPRPPSSRRPPPRSPSPGPRGPHGPRRTHPPPCPHPRTSARRHAWRT
jgi:hypothetical protein